jgi:alkylhydroperoxidase family enzyme
VSTPSHPGDFSGAGEAASRPRLPLLSAEEASRRAEECGVPAYMTRLSVFRVWLHHPRVAKKLSDLLGVLLFDARLDTRLRELIIMRLGWTTDSVYEWTQHWRIATDLGVSPEDLVGVRDWQNHGAFGPAERAVLTAVDETVEHGCVSGPTWEALRAHVSDDPEVLIEVLTAVSGWRMVSALLRSLEVPLEPGVARWPPDGVPPPRP